MEPLPGTVGSLQLTRELYEVITHATVHLVEEHAVFEPYLYPGLHAVVSLAHVEN